MVENCAGKGSLKRGAALRGPAPYLAQLAPAPYSPRGNTLAWLYSYTTALPDPCSTPRQSKHSRQGIAASRHFGRVAHKRQAAHKRHCGALQCPTRRLASNGGMLVPANPQKPLQPLCGPYSVFGAASKRHGKRHTKRQTAPKIARLARHSAKKRIKAALQFFGRGGTLAAQKHGGPANKRRPNPTPCKG